MASGNLIIRPLGNGNVQCRVRTPGGELSVPWAQITSSLQNEIKVLQQGLDGIEVEFEREGGRAVSVRRPGAPLRPQATAGPARHAAGGGTGGAVGVGGKAQGPVAGKGGWGGGDGGGGKGGGGLGADVVRKGDFHNPYNFVPAPPRRTSSALGDRPPSPQDRYLDDHWSGRIRVRMTTKTPLLVVDAAKRQMLTGCAPDRPHFIYATRADAGGRPLIPPATIKGCVRAGFEAITNSRFGVFGRHDRRLGVRMGGQDGLGLVPARVTAIGPTGMSVDLLPGNAGTPGPDGTPRGRYMYAAWYQRWNRNNGAAAGPPAFGPLAHGAPVQVWTQTFAKVSAGGAVLFEYERVVGLGPAPRPAPLGNQGAHRTNGVMSGAIVHGWVCRNEWNFPRKHDERVFLAVNSIAVPVNAMHARRLQDRWTALIEDYREQDPPPAPPGGAPLTQSRHVTTRSASTLAVGDLAYARVRQNGAGWDILDLYPVMISRHLTEQAPAELLDQRHLPAASEAEMSPADRVFGWVGGSGDVPGVHAWRGKIRFGPVRPGADARVDSAPIGRPLPLAILGEPKPKQVRFYGAKNLTGAALTRGTSKVVTGYAPNEGLRGRKVYPHHASLPEGYWSLATDVDGRDQVGGRYREYARAGRIQDHQNRSIESWIAPESTFTFDLDVLNLEREELGALLWLLFRPEGELHRAGGGKPLGFGSVHLVVDWDGTRLARGQGYRAAFRDLRTEPEREHDAAKTTIAGFQAATIATAGGVDFEQVPYIRAFRRSLTGHDTGLPTHYPRVRTHGVAAPSPDGENFKWFAKNEARPAARVPLGPLSDDRGLPFYDEGQH